MTEKSKFLKKLCVNTPELQEPHTAIVNVGMPGKNKLFQKLPMDTIKL